MKGARLPQKNLKSRSSEMQFPAFSISGMKKDILKRKTPFFCISKGLSNKQEIFFMSYAL